ncbi:MAG: O-antigen ligase family protein [Myxococcaceae bacterium]
MSDRLRAVITVGLCLWAAGVQITEGLAVAGMTLTFLALVPLAWRQRAESPKGSGVLRDNAFIFAFVLWALLGPLLGGHTPTGTGFARTTDWLWIPIGAAAFRQTSARQRLAIGLTAGVVLLLSCLCAALQHFGAWPSEDFFTPLRFTKLHFERVYEPAPNDPGRFMAGGLAFHRIRFSHVTVLLVAFASAVPAGKWQWPARVSGLIGAVSVLLFPLARAAAAAGLAGTGAGWVLSAQQRKRSFVAVAGLILLAFAAVGFNTGLRTRMLSSLNAEGSGDREVLIGAGIEAVKEHPFTGVGAGQFRPSKFAGEGTPQYVLDNPGKAHNMFLSMAAEFGVLGALLFAAVLIFELRRFTQAGRLGAPGIAVVITFALVCLVHDPLFHSEVSMALMLLLAASRACAQPR